MIAAQEMELLAQRAEHLEELKQQLLQEQELRSKALSERERDKALQEKEYIAQLRLKNLQLAKEVEELQRTIGRASHQESNPVPKAYPYLKQEVPLTPSHQPVASEVLSI